MMEYGTDRDESDRRESDSEKSEEGPSKANGKASTSANEQLRRSTRQKNPVVRFGYNEYVKNRGIDFVQWIRYGMTVRVCMYV